MNDFLKALNELIERSKEGAIILVEGRRDVQALRELGVEGKIVPVSNVPKASIVDRVEGDVIILTDWDEKGEILKRCLFNMLLSNGIVADIEIRRRIFSSVDVTEVEDLTKALIRLQTRQRF